MVVSFYKLRMIRGLFPGMTFVRTGRLKKHINVSLRVIHLSIAFFFAKKNLLLRAIFLEVAYFMDPNTRPHRKMFMCLAKIWLGCFCSLDDLNVLRC